MTYATQQDLIDRFGQDEIAQLSDTEGTGALDPARVGRVLTDADARINGYLGTRYVLPLSTTPPILVNLAADIARYLLAKNVPTDEMRARFDDAIKWLTNVAKGDFSLPDQAGLTPAQPGGAVAFSGAGRTFTSETLRDYIDPSMRPS